MGNASGQTTTIYHITTRAAWQSAVVNGQYTADSLSTEGFIHASTARQVLRSAQAHFHGRSGLILLQIDTTRLTARLVFEDLYATGQAFPHLYGTLNLDAVTAVIDFPPNPDGTFDLPDTLKTAG